MHAQKVTFILIQKVVSKTKKNKFRIENRMIHDWQETSGRVETHHRTFGLITPA
jgi:hypothetical protein